MSALLLSPIFWASLLGVLGTVIGALVKWYFDKKRNAQLELERKQADERKAGDDLKTFSERETVINDSIRKQRDSAANWDPNKTQSGNGTKP